MEWQQLEYFQVLSRIKNFTKAAEELSLTQSALSRSIAKLEQQLGVQLFDRQLRGVTLNPYGEYFLEYVNRALKEISFARKKINELVELNRGSVSLGFIHTLGSTRVPGLVGKFREQYPEVRLQFVQDTTPKIMSLLASGEIDLGLCSPNDQMDSMSVFPVIEEEIFLIVPKEHRLADREQADLIEVAEDPFIIYKKETGIRKVIEKFCAEAGFEPSVAFEGVGEETLAGFVAANLGVALVPYISGLDSQQVSILRVSKPCCRSQIHLVWRKDRYLSPATIHLKQFIQASKAQGL